MKVRFTAEARIRLRIIHAYIAQDSLQNADALIGRIIERAESLSDLPLRGRKVPEYDDDAVREVPEEPYRIIYRVTENEIQIVTVMHNRRLLPGDLAGLR